MLAKPNLYFFALILVLLAALSSAQLLPWSTALLVAAFALVLITYRYCSSAHKPFGKYIAWILAVALGIGVGLYRPAGFNYPLVFSLNQLHEGGLPFSLYINIGKLLAGYITVYFLLSFGSQAYIQSRAQQFLLAFGLGLFVVFVAYVCLDLAFHLKPLKYIVLFGLVNLLVTCVAEEAFMRLLLQTQLQKFLSGKLASGFWLEAIPLFIATGIFVLTHFSASVNVLLVFALAGFCYGLVYSLTKNLWACVAVHFTVNIVHFSLLTYPLA
ncbi:MAG: CPBP family intramembrane metalloprotease [Moraxellaceae bacterium]|nr:MAG: CPBP family intramembrane metalloprotease [Moraxellaceae bacterium]